MPVLCGMPHEDVKWPLVFDLEQCAGECCRGRRIQEEVAEVVAPQVKPEPPELEEDGVVAAEEEGQDPGRSERLVWPYPVESRSP